MSQHKEPNHDAYQLAQKIYKIAAPLYRKYKNAPSELDLALRLLKDMIPEEHRHKIADYLHAIDKHERHVPLTEDQEHDAQTIYISAITEGSEHPLCSALAHPDIMNDAEKDVWLRTRYGPVK